MDGISRRFDTLSAEVKWQAIWQSLRTSNSESKPKKDIKDTFVVDSPPPTVSGSLHIGHVFSYTHQDILARHRRMTNREVVYPMGWDDNGLPTERRVQAYYGIQVDPTIPYEGAEYSINKKDSNGKMVKVSRQKFIEMCSKLTQADEQAFKELFIRMGFSIDWEHEYTTISDNSRRIAQQSFVELFENGQIYQSISPTMWDITYQTAVAQAEVEDRQQRSTFNNIHFALEDTQESIIISTTRPELLAACVALAVHPNDDNSKHLIGKHAIVPCFFNRIPIVVSPMVDPEKGTGVLMVCTFGDQVDVAIWKEHKLNTRQIIGKDGRIQPYEFSIRESIKPKQANANYAKLENKTLPQARKEMLTMLREQSNSVVDNAPPLIGEPIVIRHWVRFYEKGENPIEYVTSRQWFVNLMDKKGVLLVLGSDVNWHPQFMFKRYENWTLNLNTDWCISRQRFFGVPIPVWYKIDSKGDVIYKNPIIAEKSKLPVDPTSMTPPGYTEEQRDKPNGFTAEKDVFDTWFTSSMTPQIVAGWQGGNKMSNLFPMDVRPQSHEIIRTWAFYTIAKSILHHNQIPWKNIVISGWILDPERKKMSKSKGNVVTPSAILDTYGVDAIRYWAGSARLGMDTTYDEKVFRIGAKLVTKLFNAGKFVFTQSAQLGDITQPLDIDFIQQLELVTQRASQSLELFDYALALQEIERFFWNGLTDNYIELVKYRARDATSPEAQTSAVSTLRLATSVFIRLFAPFLPYITEEIWSWSFAQETGIPSVHMAPWPDVSTDTKLHNINIRPSRNSEGAFEAACEAIAAVRKAKSIMFLSLGANVKSIELHCSDNMHNLYPTIKTDLLSAARAQSIVLKPPPHIPSCVAVIQR